MPDSVIVLLKVVMPVVAGDTVRVMTAGVVCPAARTDPCLSQLTVM